jgi:hypothetical protein
VVLTPTHSQKCANEWGTRPVTPEEKKALAEAREWSKQNKSIPHEQVLAELGITQEEVNRFKFEEPK